jgi:transposase-like protein
MTVKIPLRLLGIDPRDTEAYGRIPPELEELFWMANGAVSLAVVLSDDHEVVAVADAADWARRIAKHMPGVLVAEVYDELVSVSDIAARAGVAPEAVRLWAARKRRASLRAFPAPHQVVGTGSGGKTMSLYAWREVLSWIREILGTDPDEGIEYLSDTQLADLNAHLAAIRAERSAWHPIAVDDEQINADFQQVCQQARISFVTASFAGNSGSDNTQGQHRKLRVELQ